MMTETPTRPHTGPAATSPSGSMLRGTAMTAPGTRTRGRATPARTVTTGSTGAVSSTPTGSAGTAGGKTGTAGPAGSPRRIPMPAAVGHRGRAGRPLAGKGPSADWLHGSTQCSACCSRRAHALQGCSAAQHP